MYCIAAWSTPAFSKWRLGRCLTTAESRRYRGRPLHFRFRGGAFVADGSELHWARRLAFFAPVSLRTGKALPHPAIIANENFFSHAKEVSTARDRVCQGLFFIFTGLDFDACPADPARKSG
jgi:hypothetical protein